MRFSYDSDVEEIKVTATDVSAKTITVDGGTWDTSNQSQVWSSGISSNGVIRSDKPAANAFDGSVTTECQVTTNTENLVFTPSSPITYTNKVEVYINWPAGTATTTATGAVSPNTWTDIPNNYITLASGGGTFTSVTLTGNSGGSTSRPTINAIRVDGRILVDPVNDSQVWSSICTYVNGNLNRPLSLFFDGQLNLPLYADGQRRATITFPSVVPAAVGEIYGQLNGATDPQWRLEVNDVPVIQGNDNGWTSINTALAAQGGLKTISFGDDAFGIYPAVYGVRLDGKLLVDPGVRDLGDSKVSTVSPKQGEGTISDITGSVVTIEPFTDNCFKEGQYLTVDKAITVDPKTDPIAGYTTATKTLTFDGPKDLLQFAPGDTVSMCNADGTPATFEAETSEIVSVSTNSYSVAGGGNARANIGNMFDGDTSTNGECDIGTTNILFDEPISGVTKIEYYTLWNNNRVDASPAITIN